MPDCMDRLHRRQMTGAIHVDRRFNSHVGIGSREQDFDFVEITNSFNGRRRWPLHVRCCKKSSRSLSHLLMSSCIHSLSYTLCVGLLCAL